MTSALLLLAALLAVLVQAQFRGRSIASWVARLVGRGDRARRLVGWAAGTAVTFAVPALVALILLGRVDALGGVPGELRLAVAGPTGLELAASLGLGAVLGTGLLIWRGRAWEYYRSPAAARTGAEWPAAALVAVSAGVSEELFFRLALPLMAAIVLEDAVSGWAVASLAFALAHRHQGWIGVLATGVVGTGLGYIYLLTGAIGWAMLVHVAMDLHTLVLQPLLLRNRPLSSRGQEGERG